MLWFDGAPAIPSNLLGCACCPRRKWRWPVRSYVADTAADPSEPVRRPASTTVPTRRLSAICRLARLDVCHLVLLHLRNFCVIRMPLMAIEELILEFKAPNVLDTPDRRIASLYAGAGAEDPISEPERASEVQELKPH